MTLMLGLFSGRAFAFPENIREGYPSCASCHVAASGGGPLTEYGRGASEAFMATWAREGEGSYFKPAKGISLGGDQRMVRLYDPLSREATFIPMQADAQVALKPIATPEVTYVASVGSYGPDHTVEYRRSYAALDVSPTVRLRAGRFLPAYGVGFADHTTETREGLGFGEGKESWNAEASWLPPGGEVMAAATFGQDQAGPTEVDGAVGRAAAYIAGVAQVGISGLMRKDGSSAGGAFVMTGITRRAFLLAEVDGRRDPYGVIDPVAVAKLGVEATTGLILYTQGGTDGPVRSGLVGLQWIPRPHWELAAEWRRAAQDTGLLLVHHWL